MTQIYVYQYRFILVYVPCILYSQFIIQTNKCKTYILIIFYILYALPYVSMHLHYLQ